MKKKKSGNYKIPFDYEGNLMDYETNLYISARNYNKKSGEIEVYEDGEYRETNINEYSTLIEVRDLRYGSELSYSLVLAPEWCDNIPFEAVLVFDGYSRGRSAAHTSWQNKETGAKYTMFLTHFDSLMRSQILTYGETPKLLWDFVKYGQNYGIKMAEV